MKAKELAAFLLKHPEDEVFLEVQDGFRIVKVYDPCRTRFREIVSQRKRVGQCFASDKHPFLEPGDELGEEFVGILIE